MTFLFDIGPPGGTIGIGIGIAFLLAAFTAAYIAFRMLRKTVKMALRMLIVAVILGIGLVGTMAFFYMGSGNTPRNLPANRPAANRQR